MRSLWNWLTEQKGKQPERLNAENPKTSTETSRPSTAYYDSDGDDGEDMKELQTKYTRADGSHHTKALPNLQDSVADLNTTDLEADKVSGALIFCHTCQKQWYQDGYHPDMKILVCRECQSEFVEIVSLLHS